MKQTRRILGWAGALLVLLCIGCAEEKMRARIAAMDDATLVEIQSDYRHDSKQGILIVEELRRRNLPVVKQKRDTITSNSGQRDSGANESHPRSEQSLAKAIFLRLLIVIAALVATGYTLAGIDMWLLKVSSMQMSIGLLEEDLISSSFGNSMKKLFFWLFFALALVFWLWLAGRVFPGCAVLPF